MARVINIKNDVIVGRAYKMYNSIDNYIYIGSTTLPLTKRLGDHMYAFNQGIKSQLYNHMREIDLHFWTIELIEARFVNKISELRQMEQKWIDLENPMYLLNHKNAIRTDNSLVETKNKIYRVADEIVKPILEELLDGVIDEISQREITNVNDENKD